MVDLRQVIAWTTQFSLPLVLLAALVCAAGSFTVIALLGRAMASRGRSRWLWLGGLSVSFGADVWATHFVAMLAFDPGVPCSYRITRTIVSIVIAAIGCIPPFILVILRPGRFGSTVLAGMGLGATIGAMHFLGMSAMDMPCKASNTLAFEGMSTAFGMVLSGCALRLASRLDRPSNAAAATLCLILAICGLHFTAMGGFSLDLPVSALHAAGGASQIASFGSGALQAASAQWLAGTIAGVSSLILLSAFSMVVADLRISAVKTRGAETLQYLARHDELTQLPNRLFLRERLEQMIAARPDDHHFALFYVDLDRFKPVNDIYGHAAGDRMLAEVAGRLRALVRDVDLPVRFGGDEFIVVQPAGSPPASAAALATRLIDALAQPFIVEGQSLKIGASVGIAFHPADGATIDDLLRNADTALYRAKAAGGGQFRCFEPEMSQQMLARRLFEQDFHQALEARQFVVHYQPIFHCNTARLTGFESLLRWTHPVRGMVSPAEFIPFAEKSGLIVELGLWVLETACRQAATWPGQTRIAVNVSAVQLRSPGFDDQVRDVLDRTGLPPGRLELEITETALIESLQHAQTALKSLKDCGVRLALDDFGTGYSSLNYLRRFSFGRIKIDQSFVRHLETSPDCAVIVRAIVGLGHSLGISVTAEGVERPQQLEILREQGCDQVQGYLLGRPVSADNIIPLIELFLPEAGDSVSEDARNQSKAT
jgi:diguanylate cyclase (GGDEF)-like protein